MSIRFKVDWGAVFYMLPKELPPSKLEVSGCDAFRSGAMAVVRWGVSLSTKTTP